MKKKPLTYAQKAEAYTRGVNLALVLAMTVLYDKMGFDNDAIAEFWVHCEKLSEEIHEGRVNLKDLTTVLHSEYGVKVD